MSKEWVSTEIEAFIKSYANMVIEQREFEQAWTQNCLKKIEYETQ